MGEFLKDFLKDSFVVLPPPAAKHAKAACDKRQTKTKTQNGRERITFRAGKSIHKIKKYYGLTMILNNFIKITLISNLIRSLILFFEANRWIEFYLLFSDRLLKTRPEFLSAALHFQTG